MSYHPGQMVTVFRSRLRSENADAYREHVAVINALAASMPGYIEHKSFTAEDGERVTLVTFADRDTHEAWRVQPDHRDAQRAGVRDYYAEYSIAVGAVEHASNWVRPGLDSGLDSGP